jgi:hypothetical protein
MRPFPSLLLILILATPARATAQDAGPVTTAAAEIAAARAHWVAALNQRDTLALLRSHTDDATIINATGRLLAAGDLPAFTVPPSIRSEIFRRDRTPGA